MIKLVDEDWKAAFKQMCVLETDLTCNRINIGEFRRKMRDLGFDEATIDQSIENWTH